LKAFFVSGLGVLLSLGLLVACGPEASLEQRKDEIAREEKDRQDKLKAEAEREKLERQRDARLPKILSWEGCYDGVYFYGGEEIQVHVKLVKSSVPVFPGENLEPVAMPVLLGGMKSKRVSDGANGARLGEFSANEDASFIQFQGSNYLELEYSEKGSPTGLFQGTMMSTPVDISLSLTDFDFCVKW